MADRRHLAIFDRARFLALTGAALTFAPATALAGPTPTPAPKTDAMPTTEPAHKPTPKPFCSAKFVDAVHKYQPDCDPTVRKLTERCTGNMYRVIFPGSEYDSVAGKKLAAAEIDRSVDFYKTYCIDLTVIPVVLDAKVAAGLKATYATWFKDVVAYVGGKAKLGKSTISTALIDDFHALANTIQKYVQDDVKPTGLKLVVVFMDEYIGGSDDRDTLVSSCASAIHQIGINWIDSKSPFILAHELIHALGKESEDTGGAVTWPHSSNCPKTALSDIPRKDGRVTVDLSDRYLDIAEYLEIGKNRGAGILKCSKI